MTVMQHLAHPTGWWWLADIALVLILGVIVIDDGRP